METTPRQNCLDYFNAIYDATYRDMLRYALVKARCIEDVEDLLQTTYAKFYRRICRHGYDDIGSARAYLVTLLHKELARYYRFRAEKRETELPYHALTADDAVVPERIGVTSLTLSEIWDAVKSMPVLSQKAFLLYYGFDQPIAEIARSLSLSETAVKSRLHRARAFVRSRLCSESAPAAHAVGEPSVNH